MKNARSLTLNCAVAVSLVGFGLLLAGCDKKEQAGGGFGGGNAATRVIVAEVWPQNVTDKIEALGTAKSNESIEIKSRVASLVTRIGFQEGELVAKGDLLIELENSEIRAGLAVAEASLSESRSIYNRSKSLIDTQAISAANLEQLQAAMQVNEAQVSAAKARLANTVIRAPFSGRMGLRRISPGGYVDTQTVITTLDDTSTIKLDFSVPETFLTVVTEGMNIVARSLVYPDRTFLGKVDSIDTRLDPVARSVQVRALIANDEETLKPGMFLTVDLERERGELLIAPEESIVPEGRAQFVFVVEDDKASRREVVLGRRIPGSVEIVSGLSPGDVVVTEGTHKIRDGSLLEIVDQHAAGLAPGGPAQQ